MAEEHAAAYIESAEEFQETLASNAVVVVDFTASWCGPCQMIAPIYEDMAKANQAIKFVKVDVDKLDDVAAQVRRREREREREIERERSVCVLCVVNPGLH